MTSPLTPVQTGLFYMKHQSCVELGIQDKTTLTETCYRRALDAFASSDFMAVHSSEIPPFWSVCWVKVDYS